MADALAWTCQTCGNVGMADGSDGFYYCLQCGSQAEDIIDTGVADEDFADKGGDAAGPIYIASHRRHRHAKAIKAEPISQSQSLINATIQSQFWASLTVDDDENPNRVKIKTEEVGYYDSTGPFSDGLGPTEPEDFGSVGKVDLSFEDYYNEIRIRYIMGLQLMIEFQCEVLVREFKVSPLICGLAGTIWLRFVAATRVFDDAWVDEAINESESQHEGELPKDFKPKAKYGSEPHNMFGQRAVMIWFRSLRKKIPLSYSLAVSFLVCHIAREAVLTTDIVKWSLEGKLPYFAAFVEIEKRIGPPSRACPISLSLMFRPLESVTAQKLESLSASIAESTGLALPPVNFYAIASRYLRKLSLPLEKILPHACRIYEWSMPPDLWLSANELRLPTRVCVLSILIVAIRILYNIHGFGIWEKSLSRRHASSTSDGTEESYPKHGPNVNECGEEDCSPRTKEFDEEGSGSPHMEECSEEEEDFGSPHMKQCGEEDSAFPHDRDDSNTNTVRNMSHAQRSKSDATELLCNLEAIYNGIHENYEYSKDLPTYLQFCKDVAFAGLEPSFEDHEEQKLIEELWDFYVNENGSKTAVEEEDHKFRTDNKPKRARLDEECRSYPPREKFRDKGCVSDTSDGDESHRAGNEGNESHDQFDSSQDDQSSEQNDQPSVNTPKDETPDILKEESIRKMKQDMEENRFYYIPPRVNLKRFDYLHYVRKKDEGALTYAAHADYYILLRACAKVAQVEIRCMHIGVLNFERRLAWTEHRINHCLQLNPPTFSCEFCSDLGSASVESLGLSNLNI